MRALSLLVVPAVLSTLAPTAAADPALGAAQRRAAVEGLAGALRAQYVLPEVGANSAARLLEKLAAGGYGQARPDPFAEALTRDVQLLTRDRHVRVHFDPNPLTPAAQVDTRRLLARDNFGLSRLEILPGNVGLLDLRFLASEELAAPTLAAAMGFLANTEALILDLRQNGGGDPGAIAFLCTYFFPEGSKVHLGDRYDRPRDAIDELWTRPAVPGARYASKPIYVLVSAHTLGGGEELAYDLQAQRRAAVVGEPTGGAASSGRSVEVGGGFIAFVPTTRPVNPVTKSSWEGVGVRPDLAVPAAQALRVAHIDALRAIMERERDADLRRSLAHTLAMVARGQVERPLYMGAEAAGASPPAAPPRGPTAGPRPRAPRSRS